MERVAESLQYYVYTLSTSPEEPLTQYLALYGHTRRFFSSLEYSFNLMNITVYLPDQNIISSDGFMFRKLSAIETLGLSPEQLLLSGIDLKWKVFFNQDVPVINQGTIKGVHYISCYRSIRNISSRHIEAVYFVNVSCEELCQTLSEYPIAPDLRTYTYIINTEGVVIAHPDQAMVGKVLDEDIVEEAVSAEEGKLYGLKTGQSIIVRNIGPADLLMVTTVPDTYIQESSFILIRILVITFILVVCVSVTAALWISGRTTSRIYTLGKTIRDFQTSGNTELINKLSKMTSKPARFRDEIDELAVDFRRMSARLEESFQKILDMSLEESRLKYRLLQSKINPHFLYNILESIKTAQTMGDIKTANTMITRLAKFYRQLLRASDDMIPIRDEIEMVSAYLEIESLCRKGVLDWNIRMEEGIEHFLICKFTLQPVLENCIIHGAPSAVSRLSVLVDMVYAGDLIEITVTDNGVGMTEDQLHSLREALSRPESKDTEHYGLWNVYTRLNLYFHGTAEIKIESRKNEGTRMCIIIPQFFPAEEDL
ncbi:histidine kinase [Treponema sp. OttesenSCG-928-L16]|nr:histidine kinase [Treponema sp. OttesenSCG-928-L16]